MAAEETRTFVLLLLRPSRFNPQIKTHNTTITYHVFIQLTSEALQTLQRREKMFQG